MHFKRLRWLQLEQAELRRAVCLGDDTFRPRLERVGDCLQRQHVFDCIGAFGPPTGEWKEGEMDCDKAKGAPLVHSPGAGGSALCGAPQPKEQKNPNIMAYPAFRRCKQCVKAGKPVT